MSYMHQPRPFHSFVARKQPKTPAVRGDERDALSHSERYQEWEFHYRLMPAPALATFSGTAQIRRGGERYCELPIFEPQCNALASIDLLREQCLAWIGSRSAAADPPTFSAS